MSKNLENLEKILGKKVPEWSISDLFELEKNTKISELLDETTVDEILSFDNKAISFTFNIIKEGFRIKEESESLLEIQKKISDELKELYEEEKPKEDFLKIIEDFLKNGNDTEKISAALTLIMVFKDYKEENLDFEDLKHSVNNIIEKIKNLSVAYSFLFISSVLDILIPLKENYNEMYGKDLFEDKKEDVKTLLNDLDKFMKEVFNSLPKKEGNNDEEE